MIKTNIFLLCLIFLIILPVCSYSANWKELWEKEGGSVTRPGEVKSVKTPKQKSTVADGSEKYKCDFFRYQVWSDSQKPFEQCFRVSKNENATILVNLPDSFFSNKRSFVLTLKLESGVYKSIKQDISFDHLTPKVKINDNGSSGNYIIPVQKRPGQQSCKFEIKYDHLKKGLNILEFTAVLDFKSNLSNSSNYGFSVKSIHLE